MGLDIDIKVYKHKMKKAGSILRIQGDFKSQRDNYRFFILVSGFFAPISSVGFFVFYNLYPYDIFGSLFFLAAGIILLSLPFICAFLAHHYKDLEYEWVLDKKKGTITYSLGRQTKRMKKRVEIADVEGLLFVKKRKIFAKYSWVGKFKNYSVFQLKNGKRVTICSENTAIYEWYDCESVGKAVAEFLEMPIHTVKSYILVALVGSLALMGWAAFIIYIDIGFIVPVLQGRVPLGAVIAVNVILIVVPAGVTVIFVLLGRKAKNREYSD